MNWRELCLGDVLQIRHGFAFKSRYFSDAGSYLVLTPGNFKEEGGFRQRPGKDRYYVGDIPGGYVLQQDDLIIAMTEQGPGLLGSPAIVPESDKYLHNQRLGLVRNIDHTKLDKLFLYHLLNIRHVRAQINASATGTKVRHTAPERIYRVKATVPTDIKEQQRISSVLCAYDDLIENNRRRIELLEQGAHELYKDWFVRLRFPGHAHVRIVDGLPEGWAQEPLIEMAHLTMGQSPKSEFYNTEEQGLPFHQGVTNYGFRFVSNETWCTKRTRLAEPGDILISVRAPVGRLNVTLDRIILGRGLGALRSKSGHQSFLFYQLKSIFFKEDIMGAGAVYAAVTKKDLERLMLLHPTASLISQFEQYASAMDRQIQTLHLSNARLAQARDLLLPKLMSGELAA